MRPLSQKTNKQTKQTNKQNNNNNKTERKKVIYIFNIFAYSLAEHCSIALKLVERLEHLGSQGAIVRATLAIEVAIVAENKLQPQRLAAMSQGRIDKIADFFENSVHYPAKIRISERNAKFI